MISNPRSYRNRALNKNEIANIKLSDLKTVAALGSGAFGHVNLVRYRQRNIFALKRITKSVIVKKNQAALVFNEKKILMECAASRFIVDLYKTFRNGRYVFFLLEACMGGDVWTLLSERGCLDQRSVRFIAACAVEALEFLHTKKIIHRDLKPENLMLTPNGYCKLVDFGLSTFIPPTPGTSKTAGTAEYMAPEMTEGREHDGSADYWSLGVLIYQLLTGESPFRADTQMEIYEKVQQGFEHFIMPPTLSKNSQDIIKNLLKKLPVERLGCDGKGVISIKNHSWFGRLDWCKLRAQQLDSPLKRPIKNITDTRYFQDIGEDNTDEPPIENSGWDEGF